jgi:predicted Zn finger-like uncharacterized protein
VKFLCEQCKAKYQIADDKIVGKTVRMKCRKCGHLIEVRAEVTETSVATDRPATIPPGDPSPELAKPAIRPSPPKATALAASLTSARPIVPRPGSLAGTFKSTVIQKEEESSAPFDMSELSASDDWYVAINGVPVGPIRVAEIRRKAALGSVTEDSLVWQEGLDEWRPLRSFPELVAIVRTALLGGRTSLTPPPPEGRASTPPPARASFRPAPTHPPQRPVPTRPPSNSPAPRSNVVAITSRLATAEKLNEPPGFVAQAPAAVPVDPGVEVQVDTRSTVPPAPKKELPWIPILMVVCGLGFSITLGLALAPRIGDMLRPSAPSAVVAAPVAPPTVAAPTSAAPLLSATAEATASAPLPTVAKSAAAPSGAAKAAPSASGPGRSLDLHGLGGNSVALTDDVGNDAPKAAGQCLSEGQVQKVVQLHMVAVRRSCWERGQTTKPSVNVNVMLTVGPDGSAQGVSATGDDPTVSKCIENDVRNWHFPAMGCSQKTSIPFKFLLQ